MPKFTFTDKHVVITHRQKKNRTDLSGLVPTPDFLLDETEGKKDEEKQVILLGWNIWYFLSHALRKALKKALKKRPRSKIKYLPRPFQKPESVEFTLSHYKKRFSLKISHGAAQLLGIPEETIIETESGDITKEYCKIMTRLAKLIEK